MTFVFIVIASSPVFVERAGLGAGFSSDGVEAAGKRSV
jgi:hypothetical protein